MPQPIDMQTELARAIMADRVQDAANRSAMAAAARARAEDEEEQPVLETQVDDTPEAQSEHIDAEDKRRNPFAGTRKKRADSGAEQHQQRRKPGTSGHGFDVSV